MTVYANPDNHHRIDMPHLNVLGLHGFAQSGKDTIAKGLERYGYTRVALADPIRSIAYAIDPIIAADSYGRLFRLQEYVDQVGWDDAKVSNSEVRRLLQVIGTEVGRDMLGSNVWVDLAEEKMAHPGFWVVTDVRFLNEVDMIRRLNGTLVKVIRPGVRSVNQHVSDKGLPDHLFDHVIHNDGTIDELFQKVYDMIKSHR